MSFANKYPKEVKQILAKYPPEYKRSAVMPLLYLAQREEGYITKDAMQDIADTLEISITDVGAIVGFYTLYHDKKEGKYRMQVCTDSALRVARRRSIYGIVMRQSWNQSRRDNRGWLDHARSCNLPRRLR